MSNFFVTKSFSYSYNKPCYDIKLIASKVGLHPNQIINCTYYKRSIDARNKDNIKIVCSYILQTDGTQPKNSIPYEPPVDILQTANKVNCNVNVAVVGAGPCGLFCALLLANSGVNVTLFERGADIFERKQIVDSFLYHKADLCPHTNIQYGLGGAGTFSDGKLATGISSPLIKTVLAEFVRCGAPQDILYSATPHIGTDKLVTVVGNMRDKLLSLGVKIKFNTLVDDIQYGNKDDKVTLSYIDIKNGQRANAQFSQAVLAVGHSARDTYQMLNKRLFTIQPKPFAIGVRVEHPRQFISTAQYGKLALTHKDFQSANYKLVADKLPTGRSCYSFCMCPGGSVVCSSSQKQGVVVNGMSNYDRMADNSNSALVVNVMPNDFPQGILGGVEYQQKIEQRCYDVACHIAPYTAPAQNVTDFIEGVASTQLSMDSSYSRGLYPCNLWDILPEYICQSIQQGLLKFGKQIKGFDKCGILIAPETRTSAPVKIVRDKDTLCSVDCNNIYPAGEGCGYAGGITSSAVDGLRVAQQIIKRLS